MRIGATSPRTPAEACKGSDTQRAKQRPQLFSTAAAVGSNSAALVPANGRVAVELYWEHLCRNAAQRREHFRRSIGIGLEVKAHRTLRQVPRSNAQVGKASSLGSSSRGQEPGRSLPSSGKVYRFPK
jgi:hypothetical protein